jgi:hypothetical protein
MKPGPLGLTIFLGVVMVSCFEEDRPVPPYVPPENVETVFVQSSIYTDQTYFDFSSGSMVAENKNSEWVLAFECLESGFHIRVNSSDLWGIARTGSTDMDGDFSGSATYTWRSDHSDGNPDSTAVGDWVSYQGGEPVYTGEVMLLGQYDGIGYQVRKKMQFISVDEVSYRFLVCDPQPGNPDTVEVVKDGSFNYLHYSIENNEVRHLEPPKGEWDLLFTQYFTMLLTDDGIPTPYYVRGVLLNPNRVESALDTTTHFIDVNATTALSLDFSSAQDAIGHDWKSVEVDESTNAAEYKVRPGYTYIVRDTDQNLFKFRFKSFFNPSGEKGFPTFEFQKINP